MKTLNDFGRLMVFQWTYKEEALLFGSNVLTQNRAQNSNVTQSKYKKE